MHRLLYWSGIIVAILLVLVIAFYVYFFHLGGIESYVIGKINDAIADQSGLTVSIDRIRGGLVSDLELEGVSINYSDSVRSFSLINVSYLTARYDLSDLWNRTFMFERVQIDGVDLIASRGDDGRWLLPLPGAPKTGGGVAPAFAVDELSIENVRLRIDRTDDTLWVSDLSLAMAVCSEGGATSLEIQSLGFNSSDPVIGLDNLTGKATLADGALVFQDLMILRDQTHLKISGAVDVREWSGQVELVADGLDLEQVSALTSLNLRGVLDLNGSVAFDRNGMKGHLGLGGNFLFADLENLYLDFSFADRLLSFDTLYGTILGNCSVDGRGEVDFSDKPEQYWISADLRDFNLIQIVRNGFESDLSGRMELRGESFSNSTMLLKLDVNLHESSFDEYPLHRASGPIYITTDSLWFPSVFQVDYFENEFYVAGTIIYSGDINLDVEADLVNLDRYRERLFINQPGGRGRASATLTGRTSDPDLKGWFYSDSLWIYGLYADSAYATFDIDRFLTGRVGAVEVDFLTGTAWDVPYDTGYSLIKLDSQLVIIDTVAFRSSFAGLASKATLNQGVYPWALTIDTLTLQVLDRDFYNQSEMLVEIDSLGFDLSETAIGNKMRSIVADRRINFDETMDLALSASGIPIAPWLRLFEWDLGLDAGLSGEASISGAFAKPVFNLSGTLDSLVYMDTTLGVGAGSAHYRDGLVILDSVVVKSDLGAYRANGQFYADLSFTKGVDERLPDQPFDLAITAADREFKLVYLFLPSVEQLDGDFNADFRLSGTPRRPHLDGQAFLKDGRLKYFDLVNPFQVDSAAANMRDNIISIDTVRAFVCDKDNESKRLGYADIWGELTVKALDSLHYNIDIDIPSETYFQYDLDDVEGVVMGHLKVLGDTPPAVTGDLILSEGKYQVEFADDETGSPLMLALSGENTWDLNINIEIPSNYRIRNEDIDAEFGGFLNIIRENGLYRFIGELEILRGKGYLFDKTFRIIPDSARVIFEDIEYPNPRLDIWARSRIPVSRSGDDERGYQDLKVHVTGTLDNPEFGFFLEEDGEDAPLSYEAIVPLIVANYYGSKSNGGAFEQRISQLVSSQASQIVTRRIGVETFEIDPTYEGYLDLARTRVTLGFYTSQNLYLWGRSEVGFGQRPAAGFEYRFSRALLLEGFSDEDEKEGERFHLNLKWNLEF